MSKGKWSKDLIEEIRHLWENNLELSSIEIGNKFGVSKSAIIGIANRNNFKLRKVKIFQDRPLSNSKMQNVFDIVGKGCVWPIGHPSEDNFSFCGDERKPSSPYCKKHHTKAHQ